MATGDEAHPDQPPPDAVVRQYALGEAALTVLLAVNLAMTVLTLGGSLVVPGGTPLRVATASVFVLIALIAFPARAHLAVWIRDRPWLVVVPVGVYLLAMGLDDPDSTPLFELVWVGVFAVTLFHRPIIGIGVALIAGLGFAALGALSDGAEVALDRVGAAAYWVAVAVLAGAAIQALHRFLRTFPASLATPRRVREALPAGYEPQRALERPEHLSLPSADPRALATELTPSERAVVDGLITGLAPKQVAAERGVSLQTVRQQLKLAKRKTGARTLTHLVAIVALADALDRRQPGAA